MFYKKAFKYLIFNMKENGGNIEKIIELIRKLIIKNQNFNKSVINTLQEEYINILNLIGIAYILFKF
jgi:hypothetical protein